MCDQNPNLIFDERQVILTFVKNALQFVDYLFSL